MRITQQPIICTIPPPGTSFSAFSLFTTTAHSIDDISTKSESSKPTAEGLNPYIILDRAICFLDAFPLLGRVVANVKTPLQDCLPARGVPSTEIPGLDTNAPVLASDILSRQSSSESGAGPPTAPAPAPAPAFPGTLSGGDISDADREFALNLEQYKSLLVFSNLPLSFSSSATATITRRSQYSKKADSLLTALLGISISSSTTTVKTFHLESALIRTLSVTHHNIVWGALLDRYKKEITTAVKEKNGRKMFLVIGVKVARDAVVEESVQSGRVVDGKVALDVGTAMGVKGVGMIPVAGGRGEAKTAMMAGVVGRQQRSVQEDGVQKGRLSGDWVFAVEYKEIRLKLKLEIRGPRQQRKKEKEEPIDSNRDIQTGSNMGTEDKQEHFSRIDNGEKVTTYNPPFDDLLEQLAEPRKQHGILGVAQEQQQAESRTRKELQELTPCKDGTPNLSRFTPSSPVPSHPHPPRPSGAATPTLASYYSPACPPLPPQHNPPPAPQETSMAQTPVVETSRNLELPTEERLPSLSEYHTSRREGTSEPLRNKESGGNQEGSGVSGSDNMIDGSFVGGLSDSFESLPFDDDTFEGDPYHLLRETPKEGSRVWVLPRSPIPTPRGHGTPIAAYEFPTTGWNGPSSAVSSRACSRAGSYSDGEAQNMSGCDRRPSSTSDANDPESPVSVFFDQDAGEESTPTKEEDPSGSDSEYELELGEEVYVQDVDNIVVMFPVR